MCLAAALSGHGCREFEAHQRCSPHSVPYAACEQQAADSTRAHSPRSSNPTVVYNTTWSTTLRTWMQGRCARWHQQLP